VQIDLEAQLQRIDGLGDVMRLLMRTELACVSTPDARLSSACAISGRVMEAVFDEIDGNDQSIDRRLAVWQALC
jgi:hypothetical protein